MGNKTGIAWTESTWNPTRGCTVKSAGCKNCYAMALAHRFSGPGEPYEGLTKLSPSGKPIWNGKITLVDKVLSQPLRWTKPRRIFVNSVSDLFHENIPFDFITAVFAVMAASPKHTFQVLTKRPERMLEYFEWVKDQAWPDPISREVFLSRGAKHLGNGSDEDQGAQFAKLCNRTEGFTWPIPNVWLGVTVENQKAAEERIPLLVQAPAAVRFLSCEPLLESVVVGPSMKALNWVIVGGESGPYSRPMKQEWVESLMKETQEAGVKFFYKQKGEVLAKVCGASSRKGEALTDFPEHLQVREYPSL